MGIGLFPQRVVYSGKVLVDLRFSVGLEGKEVE
jgi:hypothetical protein